MNCGAPESLSMQGIVGLTMSSKTVKKNIRVDNGEVACMLGPRVCGISPCPTLFLCKAKMSQRLSFKRNIQSQVNHFT